jgi:transcriptional regulator with XRE-family HTH domain
MELENKIKFALVGIPSSTLKYKEKEKEKEKENVSKAIGARVAWSTLSEDESRRPGAMLLSLLLAAANRKGLQLEQLAVELDVTYGYFAQLRNGLRPIAHISDEFAMRCAKFLRLPRVSVLAAAGKLSVSDFYEPISADLLLDQSIQAIIEDPHYAGFTPETLTECSIEMKMFILKLYEKATGRILLPNQPSFESLVILEGKAPIIE